MVLRNSVLPQSKLLTGVASTLRLPQREMPKGRILATAMQPKALSRNPFNPVLSWLKIPEFLLGQYPAAYGLLGGGRNLLLESAQEATLMSVSTPQFIVNPTLQSFPAEFRRDISHSDVDEQGVSVNFVRRT